MGKVEGIQESLVVLKFNGANQNIPWLGLSHAPDEELFYITLGSPFGPLVLSSEASFLFDEN